VILLKCWTNYIKETQTQNFLATKQNPQPLD